MNKHRISKIIILSSIVFNCFPINTFALEKEDIYDEILFLYNDRTEYDNYFLKILKDINVSKTQHKNLLNNINTYVGSDVEQWWLIESNRLIFNDVIFSIPEIKENYMDKFQNYGQSSIYAYSVVKRELIGNIEELDDMFKVSLKSYSDLESIFKKYFNRKPTQKELSWMRESETIKYSLYGGVLGREITSQEEQEISLGRGYKILGIADDRKKEYEELIKQHNNIEIQETYYKRAYKGMEDIKNIILEYYDINIFNTLSLSERDKIYKESMNKYKFNKRKALELTINKLKDKDLIKDDITDWPEDIITPELPPNKPSQDNSKPGINDDFTTNIPTGSLNNHIQNLNKNNIYKTLTSSISDLYKKIKVGNLNGDYIFFKSNELEFPTNIKVSDDNTITNIQEKSVLKIIAKELKGKVVEGKEKTMILVNNSIG
ncbi:MAG: hypothetical protein IJH34_12430, partial [Romboutsia sp.]|nr:hypothetical protein [Romboutsia sp.]